jgi:hypothetical protein
MAEGFPLKIEPLVLQKSAEHDPTPPDYEPGEAPPDPPTPFWRTVACPCGGYRRD